MYISPFIVGAVAATGFWALVLFLLAIVKASVDKS